MCFICAQWVKANMTSSEAWKTLPELIDSNELSDEDLQHLADFADLLPQNEAL